MGPVRINSIFNFQDQSTVICGIDTDLRSVHYFIIIIVFMIITDANGKQNGRREGVSGRWLYWLMEIPYSAHFSPNTKRYMLQLRTLSDMELGFVKSSYEF